MRPPVLLVVLAVVALVATATATATTTTGAVEAASASPVRAPTVPSASAPAAASRATPDTPALAPVAPSETPVRAREDSLQSGRSPSFRGGEAQVEPGDGPASASASDDSTSTNLTVRLRSNGDAEWTVRTESELSGPNETRVFRGLGDRYEAGRADVGPRVAPFERAIAAASEVDREMSLLEVSRSARIENSTGYLTLRFVWTNFAEDGESRIRVGDAFLTPRGTWLPGLAAGQSLSFVPPPSYGVNSAPIGPENGTLRWEGPEEFEPGSLTITYRRGLRETTAATGTTPTATATSPADSGVPLVPVAGIGALGIGVLVALYVRSRGLSLPSDDRDDGDDSPAESGGIDAVDGEPNEVSLDSDADPASGGSESAPGASAGTGREVGIDEGLLSDEERVERLLEANGGRMRQAAIVAETRWSNAKVSQLLSAMDHDGRIDKLRIGRENLISLPDEDVSDAEND